MTMAKPHVAIIVGSNRRESINRKLAHALAKLGADHFNASIVRIDDLPMFNQDNEGNLTPEIVRFKDEISRADGVMIITPEHDRSIPAVLKNAVDWGARPYGKNSWAGKPAFNSSNGWRKARPRFAKRLANATPILLRRVPLRRRHHEAFSRRLDTFVVLPVSSFSSLKMRAR